MSTKETTTVRTTINVTHNGIAYSEGDLIRDSKIAEELLALGYAKSVSLKKEVKEVKEEKKK